MDYFNELLESYTRLKKRTFKLTFINEQEDKDSEQGKMDDKMRKDAEEQALAIAKAGVSQFFDANKNAAKELYAFRKAGKDEAGNKIPIGNVKGANGPFGTGTPEIADAGGNPMVDSEGWKKLVNYFLQGDAVTDEVQKTKEQELEDLLAKAEEKIGGAFWTNLADQLLKDGTATTKNQALQMAEEMVKANPELIGGKSVINSYKKQIKHAYFYRKELLAKYPEGLPEELSDLDSFIKNPIIFIAGSSSASLEKYLSKGTAFSLDDKGDQIITELHPGAVQDAVLANEFLLSFLDPSDDNPYKCADLRKTIGVEKTEGRNRFILFGSQLDDSGNPTEGVVVKSNKLQEKALSVAAEKCSEEAGDLNSIINGKFNRNNKNAIKGSIYEVVPRITVLLNKLAKDRENKEIKKQLKTIIEDVIRKEKLPILEEVAAESGSLSLDAYIEQQEAAEQLDIISSKKNLAAWILTEARLMSSFTDMLPHEPADVLHVALSPKTGDRPDNSFLYVNQNEAQESAKKVGGTVVSLTKSQILEMVPQKKKGEVKKQLDAISRFDDQPIHLLNIAQKRMVDHVDTKIGELNRQETMDNYMASKDPKGNVADGFFEALDELVPMSDSDTRYYKSMEKFVRDAVAPFRETTIYSSNGMLKIQNPEQLAKMVAKNLKGKFSEKQIRDLNLNQLFFYKGEPRDFSDRIVQERIAEGLERNIRMAAYKKDLRDPAKKQKAEVALLRQSLICGYTVNDMPQLKGTNDGKIRAWSHNEPMRQAVADWKAGNLDISVEGNTASFTRTGDDPLTYMKFSQEGTYSGSGETRKRETRSQTKVTKEAIDKFNIVK